MKTKKRFNKKRTLVFVTTYLLFSLFGAFFQRHALACEVLPVMGYQQINSKVFLAQDISPERTNELSQLVDSAIQRITDVYGAPISKPWILITSDARTSTTWGANETASTHRMPWCTCIIVGPHGQNVDVIAHELLHAEIQHRVGLWRLLKEIPVWFDEGAALTVDYRKPFLPETIKFSHEKIIKVERLDRYKDFFSGNIRENYQASRMAVIPLIREDSFYKDLERIASGETFQTVFLNNDTSKLPKYNVMPEMNTQ